MDFKDLPDGATAHVLNADRDVKSRVEKLLKDFSSVFPAELPMEVPANRGLNDEHKIPLVEGAKPPHLRMYK